MMTRTYIYRFFTMIEMIAPDVPGSWRFMLYMGALCGGSNVYQCHWLPRWLRCLSVVYQMMILTIDIIVIGVALAGQGSSHSLFKELNKNAVFSIYFITILCNIVILWQTFRGSGVFDLLQKWKLFQIGNLYAVKNRIWRSAVILIVGLITISLALTFIVFLTIFTVDGKAYNAQKLFPALDGHNIEDVIFLVHIIILMFALLFCYSYLLLCFVVIIDITFLIRTLREQLNDVFWGLIVDVVALKRCVNRVNGAWELVDAANGAFGASLGMYLVLIIPNVINFGFQFVERQGILYLPPLASGVGVLILIFVPSAILVAQVRHQHRPSWLLR